MTFGLILLSLKVIKSKFFLPVHPSEYSAYLIPTCQQGLALTMKESGPYYFKISLLSVTPSVGQPQKDNIVRAVLQLMMKLVRLKVNIKSIIHFL